MAFTVIAAADPVLASVTMGNFRHSNYGSDVLPMNATGVSVDDTLNLGSSSKRWANIHTKKLSVYNNTHLVAYMSGDLTIDESAGTPYYLNSNYSVFDTALVNSGGFSGWSGGDTFVIPESGLYRIDFKASLNHYIPEASKYEWITAIDNPIGSGIAYANNYDTSGYQDVNIWTEKILTSGDVIDFFVQLNKISGTSGDGTLVGGGESRTRISIRKIGDV